MAGPADICLGDVEIRPPEHLVLVHGEPVALTSREFNIVITLAEHPGWVFSASQLAGDSEEGDYSPESVSVLVSRLRQKLAAAGASDVVETVRGYGYRLHHSIAPCDEPPTGAGLSREVRDALWQLQEAVIEVEHLGSPEQQHAAAEALEEARRAIYASLAE